MLSDQQGSYPPAVHELHTAQVYYKVAFIRLENGAEQSAAEDIDAGDIYIAESRDYREPCASIVRVVSKSGWLPCISFMLFYLSGAPAPGLLDLLTLDRTRYEITKSTALG